MIERIGTFIRDVGFPVAVATYLLVRLDYLLRELTLAVHQLSATLASLSR